MTLKEATGDIHYEPPKPADKPIWAEDIDIKLIVACARNWLIGKDGQIPWHAPEDLQHFRQTTTGHSLLMGRRTYGSIVRRNGGPLKYRHTYVLSRSLNEEKLPYNVTLLRDISGLKEHTGQIGTLFIAGGETIYQQFGAWASYGYITIIDTDKSFYNGDAFFPKRLAKAMRVDDQQSVGKCQFLQGPLNAE